MFNIIQLLSIQNKRKKKLFTLGITKYFCIHKKKIIVRIPRMYYILCFIVLVCYFHIALYYSFEHMLHSLEPQGLKPYKLYSTFKNIFFQ